MTEENADFIRGRDVGHMDNAVRITKLERDLADALNFAAVPMRRCPNCKRLALVQGLICQNCWHDPSYDEK